MKKQTAKPFEKITAIARGGAFKAGRVEMPLGISASSGLLLIWWQIYPAIAACWKADSGVVTLISALLSGFNSLCGTSLSLHIC